MAGKGSRGVEGYSGVTTADVGEVGRVLDIRTAWAQGTGRAKASGSNEPGASASSFNHHQQLAVPLCPRLVEFPASLSWRLR